jgi:hypothetical protein
MTGDEFPEIDSRLRDAYAEEPVESSGLEIALQKEIGRLQRRRLAQQFTGAAAVCAVVFGSYWVVRPTPEPRLFADAARDHRIEVVQKASRHWRTADTDVDTLIARFGVRRQRLVLPGYQLLRAKVCMLDGRRVLHLVYTDLSAEYSLFLMPDVTAIPLTESSDGAERVAGFHSGRASGLVVGDGSPQDCRRFAKMVSQSALQPLSL